MGKELNLNAVTVELGLENTEYEPEQFPSVIYKPNDLPCTILLFSTGKIVITGIKTEGAAQKAYERVFDDLSVLLK